MTTDTGSTVRRSVVVNTTTEEAFTFFTPDIGRWWDPGKHLLDEPIAEMVFEPFVGGNIIDRCAGGAESCWATILAYDPPSHLAFSWDINLAWQIETDRSKVSEVHVTFTDQGGGRTLVDLEHRNLERIGAGWESMRDAVASPNGWSLDGYAEALAAAAT